MTIAQRGPARWQALLVSLGVAAAVIAAAAVLVVGVVATGEWHWASFVADLIKNAFIGSLVAAATAWLKQRQDAEAAAAVERANEARQRDKIRALDEISTLAVSGWSSLGASESAPDQVCDDISRQVAEWRKHADDLDEVHAAPRDIEAEIIFLGVLASRVELYLNEGGRTRRLIYLLTLQRELAALEDGVDPELAATVADFRRAVPKYQGWHAHTNATVIERLLVEQAARPRGLKPATPAYVRLLRSAEIPSAAASHEPLYMLFAYAIKHEDPRAEDLTEDLMDPVRRSVGALRNELRALADCVELLVPIVRYAAVPIV